MNERKTMLAIDFNNILFMSYYGQPLINSRGINVNAVKSFFFRLRTFREMFEPDYIVCASDLSRAKTFRRKMYPAYKAQRGSADPNVIDQMRYASQIFALLGFQTINNEYYEADDILGMISRLSERNDMDCVIVSSDKDLYQLVTDHTFILSPKNSDLITKKFLVDNYQLTPEQWIELKILQGDKGDNIPGIRGIGKITALKLIQTYGTIENIYDNLDKLTNKVRELLINGKNDIPLMRDLVTIVTDYSYIDLTLKDIQRTKPFEVELYELINDLEIHSLTNLMRYNLLPQYNDKIQVY
jgi:DNA polymerase I